MFHICFKIIKFKLKRKICLYNIWIPFADVTAPASQVLKSQEINLYCNTRQMFGYFS